MTSVRALPLAEQYPSSTASSSAGTSSLISGMLVDLNTRRQSGDLVGSLKRGGNGSCLPSGDKRLTGADLLGDLDLRKSRTSEGDNVGLGIVHAGNYTLVNNSSNTQLNYSSVENAIMSLRENLKALMDTHKDNPHSLHLKTGVPQPTIFRIVEGTTQNPKRLTIEKLARHYRVTVESLFGQDSPAIERNAMGRIAMDCAEIIDTLPHREQIEMLHHLRVEQRKQMSVNVRKVPRPGRPDADDADDAPVQ